jgi:4-hydroxybenzoate polyprenyltransferase
MTAAPPTPSGPGRFRDALELARLPNLLTVPGDPAAGLLLASAALRIAPPAAAWLTLPATLLIYLAGLLLGDVVDLAADRRLRPSRPLPRGAFAPGRVRALGFVLLAAGVALSAATGAMAGLMTLGLAACVLAYTFGLKRDAVAGPITMGSCRGLSVLTGAAAAGAVPPASLAALGVIAYVAAVTALARFEARRIDPGRPAWFIPLIVLGAGALLVAGRLRSAGRDSAAATFLLAAVIAAVAVAAFLRVDGGRRPALIGLLVSVLLPWQAGLCFLAGTEPAMLAGVGLLALWPVNRAAARLASGG